jgi:hypothetical protein
MASSKIGLDAPPVCSLLLPRCVMLCCLPVVEKLDQASVKASAAVEKARGNVLALCSLLIAHRAVVVVQRWRRRRCLLVAAAAAAMTSDNDK